MGVFVRVLSSRCLVCRPSHLCLCRVGPPRRVKVNGGDGGVFLLLWYLVLGEEFGYLSPPKPKILYLINRYAP